MKVGSWHTEPIVRTRGDRPLRTAIPCFPKSVATPQQADHLLRYIDPRIGRSRPIPAWRCAAAALRLSSRAAVGALWVPEVCQKRRHRPHHHGGPMDSCSSLECGRTAR